ncbi:DoxX family protein [Bosea eneae]|uniref:DoxX family protein n=1 Tax=Bosea eneae TaxID=151454 RepID=A0ABW0IXH4_9HYPH
MNRGSHPRPSETVPPVIASALTNPGVLVFARVMLTLPYWVAGILKLLDFAGTEATMARVGLYPTSIFAALTILVEIGASLLVILNRWTWAAAGALGVFTVWATFLAHRFWDFAEPQRGEQLNTFLEHASLASGFILVAAVSILLRSREGRR